MGKARNEKKRVDSIAQSLRIRGDEKKQSLHVRGDEKKQTRQVGDHEKKQTRHVGVGQIIRFGKGEDRGKKPRDSVSVLDRRVVLLYDKKKHFSCGRVPHQSTENWCCVGRTDFFIGKTHGEYRKSGKGSS